MSPLIPLIVLILLTLLAWIIHRLLRFVRSQRLRRVAAEWGMSYAQHDPFNLARRIASYFPFPNAQDLRIRDLIYCSEGPWHRYVFTAEYTRSADEGYWRERRVMTFCEPRDASSADHASSLAAAPEHLLILEQYHHLKTQNWGRPTPTGAAA